MLIRQITDDLFKTLHGAVIYATKYKWNKILHIICAYMQELGCTVQLVRPGSVYRRRRSDKKLFAKRHTKIHKRRR